MVRFSTSLKHRFELSASEIRVYHCGPAALVLMRNLLTAATVRVAMERLGVDVAAMVADVNDSVLPQTADVDEQLEAFNHIVQSAALHAISHRSKRLRCLALLVPLAMTPAGAAVFDRHGVSLYALTWQISHDPRRQQRWLTRKLNARRLAKLPPLQGDQRHVLMHNDDHTPLAFVQTMLQQHAGMTDEDAAKTAEAVHQLGWQRIATLSLADTATLLATIEVEAKTNDFPLRLSVYPPLPAARVVTRR